MNLGTALTLADIEDLDFSKGAGLLPAIVEDADSGAVLMLGYMNAAALRATLERSRVVFFSRSKDRLWEKGETSGNTLELVAVRADCDRDALLVRARARGPVCHLGTMSCFGDTSAMQASQFAFLAVLETVIERRITERPDGSYTANLIGQGIKRVAQKVGEEGLELALAGISEANERVIAEAADLLFHMMVLLKSRRLPLASVVAELAARHA
jgi:phosphoribosyl-ATP pyrophosphohydrolase/phosphoribosyl-AMP cyclohydrolase